jgi:hypothetical protein
MMLGRATMSTKPPEIKKLPVTALKGIVPKPPRPVSVEEMDEAVRQMAVARDIRSKRSDQD